MKFIWARFCESLFFCHRFSWRFFQRRSSCTSFSHSRIFHRRTFQLRTFHRGFFCTRSYYRSDFSRRVINGPSSAFYIAYSCCSLFSVLGLSCRNPCVGRITWGPILWTPLTSFCLVHLIPVRRQWGFTYRSSLIRFFLILLYLISNHLRILQVWLDLHILKHSTTVCAWLAMLHHCHLPLGVLLNSWGVLSSNNFLAVAFWVILLPLICNKLADISVLALSRNLTLYFDFTVIICASLSTTSIARFYCTNWSQVLTAPTLSLTFIHLRPLWWKFWFCIFRIFGEIVAPRGSCLSWRSGIDLVVVIIFHLCLVI